MNTIVLFSRLVSDPKREMAEDFFYLRCLRVIDAFIASRAKMSIRRLASVLRVPYDTLWQLVQTHPELERLISHYQTLTSFKCTRRRLSQIRAKRKEKDEALRTFYPGLLR
jgi:GTP1/Obg family GTP-binding protein